MNLIFIHGGAGRIPKEKVDNVERGIRGAVLAGKDVLDHGGSAIEAVIESIAYMEDSGIFNAGRGSALNLEDRVEFDAAIATSKGDFGAVAAVPNVKNPIKLAFQVMQKTRHKILAGYGAKKFAEKLGFEEYAHEELLGYVKRSEIMERLSKYYSPIMEMYRVHRKLWGDTVGAIAIDEQGLICAGVSTGGIWMKLPGRVGDSPIYGAGIYASPIGAAVATGVGEIIIMANLAFRVINGARGSSLYASAKSAIRYINRVFGTDNAGLIAVTKFGDLVRVHNTEYLSSAIWWSGLEKPIIDMYGDKYYTLKL